MELEEAKAVPLCRESRCVGALFVPGRAFRLPCISRRIFVSSRDGHLYRRVHRDALSGAADLDIQPRLLLQVGTSYHAGRNGSHHRTSRGVAPS